MTPDRDLARRVGAELTRFGIEIDDSAGEPLSASAYGTLASRIIAAATAGAESDLVALLAHPMTRLGLARADILQRAPLFEIGVLRQERRAATFPTQAEAITAYRHAARGPFAHPAQLALNDADWAKIADLFDRLDTALAPLKAVQGRQDLRLWIDAHRVALAEVTRGEDAVFGDDADALENLFDELLRANQPDLRFDADGYAIFLAQVMGGQVLRRPGRTHPRLKIFGLLEARLMPADVMVARWPRRDDLAAANAE